MTDAPQSVPVPVAVAFEQTLLHVPSQPEYIAPTVEYLKDKAIFCGVCPEARAGRLMLALHEALTNSVIHGNLELSSQLKERSNNSFAEALAQRAADPHFADRAVEVRVDYDGQRCQWTFTDQGRGFDVARVLARAAQAEPEEMLASGRGIVLMKSLLDDVSYDMGGRRAVLTLARPGGEDRRFEPRGQCADERRAHPRAAYTARIGIEVQPDQPTVLGFGRDLSRGGIAFLTDTALPLQNVVVSLPQHEQAPLRLRARIVRCQQLLSGIHEVGACFLDVG